MTSTNNNRKTFGYMNLWAKDSESALVATGSISFKREQLAEMMLYLDAQEDRNGYVSVDVALFSADEGKSYDFTGKLQERYVKEAAPVSKPRRSL